MNRLHTSIHLPHASVTVNGSFGELLSVTPMTHVPGNGHVERIKCQYRGACFEFEITSFIELLRSGQEAVVARWPKQKLNGADLSGSVADLEAQG